MKVYIISDRFNIFELNQKYEMLVKKHDAINRFEPLPFNEYEEDLFGRISEVLRADAVVINGPLKTHMARLEAYIAKKLELEVMEE